MRCPFVYHFPEAKEVSIIGDFNNWNGSKNKMTQNEEGIWVTELDLLPGEYHYKYLVDNIIRMNDPMNNLYIPDEQGELNTLLIINEQGERMESAEPFNVHIENYHLTNRVDETTPTHDKKVFNLNDEQIVCRLEFLHVTGVHNVSILWYRPDQEFYYMTENILWTPEEEKGKSIIQWYWIQVREDMPIGKWTIKLYINGSFIFSDEFIVQPTGYYMYNGRINLR